MDVLLLVAWVVAVAPAQAPPPVSIDRIVARVNDDIIQSLEVRRARILKLFGPDAPAAPVGMTDDAVLDRLIDRRLELADAARYEARAPSDADVAARRDAWLATLGRPSAAEIAARLQEAGMTDAALADWFRDDVRLDTIETQRFSSAPATRDEILTYVREHSSGFSSVNGRVDVDDPVVQAKARAEIGAAKRAAAVTAWVASLRKRAQIAVIR